jgi:hypothetical protein
VPVAARRYPHRFLCKDEDEDEVKRGRTVSNRRSQEPANCGLWRSLREISRFERVRGGAERVRTISQDIMPDRAAGDDAPAAVEIPSFTHLSVPRTPST